MKDPDNFCQKTTRIGRTINTAYRKNPLHLWYFYPDNFNIGFRQKKK